MYQVIRSKAKAPGEGLISGAGIINLILQVTEADTPQTFLGSKSYF